MNTICTLLDLMRQLQCRLLELRNQVVSLVFAATTIIKQALALESWRPVIESEKFHIANLKLSDAPLWKIMHKHDEWFSASQLYGWVQLGLIGKETFIAPIMVLTSYLSK